jgi:hypothetical protein
MSDYYTAYNEGMRQKNVAISYKRMCEFFQCEDTQLAMFVFMLYETKETNTIDIRTVLISLSSVLFTSATDLLQFQLSILDEDRAGYITEEELALALQANHFVHTPNEIFHKCRIILSYSKEVRRQLSE